MHRIPWVSDNDQVDVHGVSNHIFFVVWELQGNLQMLHLFYTIICCRHIYSAKRFEEHFYIFSYFVQPGVFQTEDSDEVHHLHEDQHLIKTMVMCRTRK